MPKLKEGTVIPTHEEDAVINSGIAADPDTFELDGSAFQQAKRLEQSQTHPVLTGDLRSISTE